MGTRVARTKRAGLCGKTTTFCCSVCSTADSLVAIHPTTTNYSKSPRVRDCLERHRADPTEGKRRHPHGKTGKRVERDEEEFD